MKSILSICLALVLVVVGIFAWKYSGREDHFGHAFTDVPSASIPDMLATPESFLGKSVILQGVLKRQCPATGCWFFLSDPGDPRAKELKVEMGDTTPRLPARLGKMARVEGQLIKFGEDYEFIGVAVTFSQRNQP